MKIALVGYGKMGRMIETIALEHGHSVISRVDPFAPEADSKDVASSKALAEADVAIEFTKPDTALPNILALAARKIPTVVGTTGWHDSLDAARAAVASADSALLWSSNFSLGMNLFYKVAEYAAALFDSFSEYDVGGWESHHNRKADSPSGTAKILVSRVLEKMKRKTTPVFDKLDRPPTAEELHFASLRVGAVPGTHSLFFDSIADTIEITHTARGREGLARGALRAAEWLVSYPDASAPPRRGVFTMDDVLAELA